MPRKKQQTEKVFVPSLFSNEQENSNLVNNEVEEQPKKENKLSTKQIKKLQPITRVNPNINFGLSDEQVNERMIRGLNNEVTNKNSKTIAGIVLSNLFNIFNLICVCLAAVLLFIKSEVSDFIFVLPYSANIAIGIFQEIRSKKTIDKLSFSIIPKVKVLRNGEIHEINSENIVVDDIVLVENGQQIPGDGIVKEGAIEVNEAMITGESDAVSKKHGSEVFGGSYLVSGQGKIQITEVGDSTFIQKLARQAKSYQKPQSEILKSLKRFVWTIFFLIIPISILLIYSTTNRFVDFDIKTSTEEIRTTVTAVLGMVPSGLILLTSIALASSVYTLSKSKVLVQELYCIEMLARVDVLCLDKTGTITDGTMKVTDIIELSEEAKDTKQIISNLLYATKDSNMTSQALIEKFGVSKRCKFVSALPFSSARKYSAFTIRNNETYVIGAPEFIDRNIYKTISTTITKETKRGNRVLLLAKSDRNIENNMVNGHITPISLIVIQDNIRENAPDTLKYFKENGVRCIVISGDNPVTVSSIAVKAGIENGHKYIDLSTVPDNKLGEAVEKYTVFGRVSPSQKQLLVKELKARKKTVAMTGDGVNDILALREAHCSIAMASGSDAARNVSQIVLLNSDFGSMPKVVSEGRKVINNVQKSATLFITKNIFSFFLAVLTIYFNLKILGNNDSIPFPMTPSQLTIIDFLIVGIPSFFLTFQPNKAKISGKFLFNVFKNALPGALVIVFNAAAVYLASKWSLGFYNAEGVEVFFVSKDHIQTIITTITSITCTLVLLRVCFPLNLWKLLLCVAMMTGVGFCILNPSLQANFNFVPLDPQEIVGILFLSAISYPLIWIFSLSFTAVVKKFIKKNINYTIELRVKKIENDNTVIYNK